MLYRTICLSFLGGLLTLLYSCKPGVPDGVMDSDTMEEILYDYHLAQGMAQQAPSDSVDFYTRLYQQAVFEKYHIDIKDFDKSMEWYSRHTESLGKIYNRLSERMGNASSQSTMSRTRLASGMQSASGDSINFWHGENFILLTSQGINRCHFSEKTDTIFQPGDRLQWKFSIRWHYHEGRKNAVAVLALHYEGDSIVTVKESIFASGPQNISIRIADKKVEKVEGFIYQSSPWAERPRLMTISDTQLLRTRKRHKEEELKVEQQEPDSTAQKKLYLDVDLSDTIQKPQMVTPRKSHIR